ncbi:carboxypeptidase regulatory-like domain-containing protein [Curtobacterium sp. RRHDQ10]|uniref:carboxypeptidase regulatory-like domain-containing protein n=1 Tax=Curtobacterium phyllosphaerae TaxID=3413379 RepID=UPI003BF1885C
MRRRLRSWIAGTTIAVAAGAAALGGAGAASAATTPSSWGTFALMSTTARAYTGTMTLDGFPATTFTSTARQATVVSGASTWQGPASPPGQLYGSSRGETYLNLRPNRDQPTAADASVTTYTFDPTTPMPIGAWSFVLGDVDADQATISATDTTGAAVSPAALGYRSSYNSCSSVSPGGPSCVRSADDPDPGSDVPTWNAATATLVGNTGARDTAGATAWFSPTVALRTLTITYQQRSGFPVYQTWFAVAASISGTATLDGQPYRGATVEIRSDGALVATTTTAADGTYTVPGLARTDGWSVTVTRPSGADGGLPQTVSLEAGSRTVDVAFTSPTGTTSVTGTVESEDQPGTPAVGVPVTITNDTDPTDVRTVASNDAGGYAAAGLAPDTEYTVTAPGATPTTVTTGAAGTPGTPVPPVTVPDVAVPTSAVAGTATLDAQAYADATVTISRPDGTVVGTTTTDARGAWSFPAVARDTDYVVRITPPAGATGTDTRTAEVAAADVTVPEFAFTTPAPASVTGSGGVETSAGAPVAGTTVTLTPAGGGTTLTAQTQSDGTYTVPGLVPGTTYTASAPGAAPVTFTAGTADVAIDALVVPESVRATGTVVDTAGTPAGGRTVTVVAGGGAPATATTASDGTYAVGGLAPSTTYTASVAGAAPVTFTTGTSGSTTIPAIVVAAVEPPGGGTGGGTGGGGTGGGGPGTGGGPGVGSTVGTSAGPGSLAFTGSDPAPAIVGAGLLVALGAVFLVARAIRSRRHRDHLED